MQIEKFKLHAEVSKHFDADLKRFSKTTCVLRFDNKTIWISEPLYSKEWQLDIEDEEAISQTMEEFSQKLCRLMEVLPTPD